VNIFFHGKEDRGGVAAERAGLLGGPANLLFLEYRSGQFIIWAGKANLTSLPVIRAIAAMYTVNISSLV
jgi:hypothetical protein